MGVDSTRIKEFVLHAINLGLIPNTTYSPQSMVSGLFPEHYQAWPKSYTPQYIFKYDKARSVWNVCHSLAFSVSSFPLFFLPSLHYPLSPSSSWNFSFLVMLTKLGKQLHPLNRGSLMPMTRWLFYPFWARQLYVCVWGFGGEAVWSDSR